MLTATSSGRFGPNIKNRAENTGTAPPSQPLPYYSGMGDEDTWKCNTYPAKGCDHLDDEEMRTCDELHQKWMTAYLADREANLVEKTRRYFCEPCKADLNKERAEGNYYNFRVGECLCMSQLRETWLCGAHRADAVAQLEARAKRVRAQKEMEEKQFFANSAADLMDWDAGNAMPIDGFGMLSELCPRCRYCDSAPWSGAWICTVCRTIATAI